MTNSPTNLENAERAEMTMTPHAYAQEYEFRGDTDYTPSDFERTMIEDAILGYLGEARIAERAERGTFSPPFSYVPIPLDEEGQGPADDVDAVSVAHDVWDANCVTVATCGNEEAARSVAALMNAGVEARIRSCLIDKSEAGEAEHDVVEEGAKILAKWLRYAWDGLQDRDISAEYPDWTHNSFGGYQLQGGKPALRKVASAILALSSPLSAGDAGEIETITPHSYAQEYEFRGDGGDYTPTDAERTMIEDAICGYLGELSEAAETKK